MLKITDRAADHLILLRGERRLDPKAVPRFTRRNGRLALAFTTTPVDGDRLIQAGRVAALVAGDAAATLDTALIDIRIKDGQTYLVARPQRDRSAVASASRSAGAGAG